MKMKLKNKEKKLKKINITNILNNKLTTKNLIIFLISFFIISFIIGSIFYIYLNSNDKELIKSNINTYFTIEDSIDYLKRFKDTLLETIFNVIKIWILGISVIGIVIVIFLYFIEGFSTGFTCFSIIKTFKFKGIVGTLSFLFPSRITYLFLFFVLSVFAIRISYKIILLLFFKKDIDINKEMKRYFKILIFSLIFSCFYSVLETFITPFMIKLFNIIK